MQLNPEYSLAAFAPEREKTQIPRFHTAVSGRRYYNPSQGRFLGRDPIEETGGLNLYGFCRNNSINLWDVLGHFTEDEITAMSNSRPGWVLQGTDDPDPTKWFWRNLSDFAVEEPYADPSRYGGTYIVSTNADGSGTTSWNGLAGDGQYAFGTFENRLVPNSGDGIIRAPAQNLTPCIQCHGVSAGGFSGNVNDFAGLSAIPGSGLDARQGYSTLVNLSATAVATFGPGIAGGVARLGAVTLLPDGMGIGIVQNGRVVVADLTVATSHEALAARAGVLAADGTLTGGAQAVTWTVENGVIRTTALINFPSQTGAVTEKAVEQFLQALLKANGGG